MPMNEPNALQRIYRDLKKGLAPLYPQLETSMNEALGEFTPSVAVDIAYKDSGFIEESMKLINEAQVASSKSGFRGTSFKLNDDAVDYFLNTDLGGGDSLKGTMNSGEYQKASKIVIKDAVKQNTNVEKISKDIGKNLDNRELVNTKINELIKGFKSADATQAQKDIKKLKRRISGLKDNTPLKKSYERLVKAVEKGKAESINKAVDKAVNQQAKYINERTSRTEIARAYDMSISRAIEDEPDAIGYRWLLSPAHPRPDICDCYAEADAYGMGAGVYPANAEASIPAHPNCLCSKEIWYQDPLEPIQVGRYSQDRVNEYLGGLSDKKRGQVIGVANSEFKKDYSTGLEKKGFRPNEKGIRMVSQSIIERKDD